MTDDNLSLPAGYEVLRQLSQARDVRVLQARRGDELVSLRLEPGAAPEARAELAVLAEVTHPGLARLVDHGPLPGGGVYLARAWVAGEPLCDVQAAPERFGRLVARTCDALEHLHRRGFLHGDLKAENVLVGGDGAPVLIDFGFARAIGTVGPTSGSLLNIAPELLFGQAPDARSDLFSLGVLLLRLLSDAALDPRAIYGRFPAEPFLEAAEIDTGTLPEWSRDVVVALLEREPSRRPSSAGLVGRTLRARLGESATDEDPGAPGPRLVWPSWGGREDHLAHALARGERIERWTAAPREDVAALAREAALAAALDGLRVSVADLDLEAAALSGPRDRARWVRGLLGGGPDAVALVHGRAGERVGRSALEWLLRGALRPSSARLVWLAPEDAVPPEGMLVRAVPLLGERAVRGVLAGILRDDARLDDLAARMHAESGGVAAELQALLDGVVARGWIRVGTRGPELREGALPDWLGRGRGTRGATDLEGPALEVDQVVSLLRRPVGPSQLAAILERDLASVARALQELVASGRVVRATAETWRPAPGARRGGLGSGRRRELHARASDCLSLPAESAAHAWLAAPGRATEERLRSAIAAAREDGDTDGVLDLLGWLSAEADALGDALSDVLRAESALTWAHAEDPPRVRALCRDLAQTTDMRAAGLSQRALGQVARLEQRHDDALAHFARALDVDPAAADEVLVVRARLLFESQRHTELDALAAGVSPDGPRRAARNVHGLRAMSLVARGELDAARALLDAQLDDALTDGDAALEAATRVNLALVARRTGDAATARPLLERARELHAEAGRLHGMAQCDALLGALARDAGELADATRRLDRALEARELLGDSGGVLTVRGSLALVRAARGHARAALVELDVLAPEVRATGRGAEADLMDAERFALATRLGQSDLGALTRVRDQLDLAREPRAGVALARAAWILGDAPQASALLESARDAARRLGRVALAGAATALLGELRGEAGDETTRALGEPFDEARAGALAEEHFRCGRDDRAARLWLALARRSQDETVQSASSARAAEALAELERGLNSEEAACLRMTLLDRPDPLPSDLAGTPDEEPDMDVLSILDINHRLVEQQELGPLLGSIVEHALTLTGAERGFLILEEGGELSFDLAMDSRRGDLDAPEVELSHSVVREALKKGAALRVSDASDDPLLGAAPSVATLDLRSILCQPFVVEPGLRGVVYLDHRGRAGAFGPRAERLLGLLADQAALAIRQVRRVSQIRELNARLEEQVVERDTDLEVARRALAERGVPAPVAGLVGEAPAIRAVHALLRRVAPSELSVLVSGESGTGKELAARAVHDLSPRASGPFVSESCAALPASLIESELFGSKKGSYTGADHDRAGLFERASGGTLFLDEVGELPLELQAKLLRVLETREVRRLGEAETRPADFRLVVATNRDLQLEVEEERFRLDLLYRLDGVSVVMPSLADRVADIPLLVDHFLRLEERRGGRRRRCSEAVLARLAARAWPGNVRELRNEVQRLCVLSEGDLDDPGLVRDASSVAASVVAGGGAQSLADIEKQAILGALERCGGDKRRAAELLGVSRAKIYQRLKEWREMEA